MKSVWEKFEDAFDDVMTELENNVGGSWQEKKEKLLSEMQYDHTEMNLEELASWFAE